MNRKLKELGIAQSVTRRGALKQFGVGLAGMALAWLILLPAVAQPTGPGTALAFNGNGYVSIATTGSLTGTFTVELWANAGRNTATDLLALIGSRTPAEYGFDMKFWLGHFIHGDIGNGLNWLTTAADAEYTYAAGGWVHLAHVVTPTNYTLYANGLSMANGVYAADNPILYDANHQLTIGHIGYGSEFMTGQIDEVRIWNTARNPSEIQTNLQRRLTGSEPGLMGYWRFDEGNGPNVGDSSGHGFLGLLFSGAAWVNPTAPIETLVAATAAASGITASSARLNGTVFPNNQSTVAWFEYGTTTNYGSVTTVTPIDATPLAVSSPISGLSPGTLYHFRLAASYGLFTSFGADFAFTASAVSQGASFQFTGSMTRPRQNHTATLLPNGQVLVAGGRDGTNILASAELFDPASGTWSLTSSMGFQRAWHAATLLPSGKVLVTGGYDASNALATEEVYDPATGLWSPIAPMATKRSGGHTATLLPNGQVLVAGGADGTTDVSTAELYDPVSGTWSPTGSMTTPRASHTATLLPNGQVLVVGSGFWSPARFTAETYDPVTGTWTVTADLRAPRSGHTATLLPSGLVLVAGGEVPLFDLGEGSISKAELYDPATGTWTDTAPMVHARFGHAATLLASGLVLVTGGTELSLFTGSGTLSSSELYDPGVPSWREAQTMRATRLYHSATMLANGEVLIAGGSHWETGDGLSSAELYGPTANQDPGTWTPTGSMSGPRTTHTATLLPSNRVLVAGGADGLDQLASAEIYDATTGTWTPTDSMSVPRIYHTATLLLNGKVLVVGGDHWPSVLATAEIYDPASETWTATGSLAAPREMHTATLLFNGKVLVAGGADNTGFESSSAEVYDPATGVWTATGAMNTNHSGHTATLLPGGKVLVSGGFVSGGLYLSSAELYDPVSGTWAPTGSMSIGRYRHRATLLPNGKVLVVGAAGNPSTAELYDPATGRWLETSPRQDKGGGEFSATLLRNGMVLVAGGNTGEILSVAEVYEPVAGTWAEVAFMNSPRESHTATLLPDGQVLVTGGLVNRGPISMVTSSAELYQPGGNTNPVPARPRLINSRRLANGSFELRFLSLPVAGFTVLATTNLSAPFSDWTVLGGVTEFAPGLYQFTDANASNYPQRYYRVRYP